MKIKLFYRVMAVTMCMLLLVVGCSNHRVVNEPSEQAREQSESPEQTQLGFADSSSVPTITSVTYAYGVVPWYDRNHGDTDHMVIFYLPRQPSVVNFYGLSGYYGWLNLNGQAQLHDWRWTSSGFRVMILIGGTVTEWWGYACGTSPSHYRLSY